MQLPDLYKVMVSNQPMLKKPFIVTETCPAKLFPGHIVQLNAPNISGHILIKVSLQVNVHIYTSCNLPGWIGASCSTLYINLDKGSVRSGIMINSNSNTHRATTHCFLKASAGRHLPGLTKVDKYQYTVAIWEWNSQHIFPEAEVFLVDKSTHHRR